MIEPWSGAVRLIISHYFKCGVILEVYILTAIVSTILEKCKIDAASTTDREYKIHMKSATH